MTAVEMLTESMEEFFMGPVTLISCNFSGRLLISGANV